jgi:hypothetical protein
VSATRQAEHTHTRTLTHTHSHTHSKLFLIGPLRSAVTAIMFSKTDANCEATLARLSANHLHPIDNPLRCYARALDQMMADVRSLPGNQPAYRDLERDSIDANNNELDDGTVCDDTTTSELTSRCRSNCLSSLVHENTCSIASDLRGDPIEPNSACDWLQYGRSTLKTYAAHLRRTTLERCDANPVGFVYNQLTNQTQLDETFGLNDRQFQLFQSQSFERIMRLRLHLQQAERLQNEICRLAQPFD